MRTILFGLAATLLAVFVALQGTSLAADPLTASAATVSGDSWSLAVGAGAKYLMPQKYKGADTITNNPGNFVDNTDTEYSGGFFGTALSLAGDYKTSLALAGLNDIRLVASFNYAGGADRRSRTQSAGTGNYFVATSIDPAALWLGGIGTASDTAATRVSVNVDNFDLSLGLEGKAAGWTFANGYSLTPVFGAGLLASTQRYKVSTRIASLSTSDVDSLVESIRTYDLGPELRAGLAASFSGGVTVSATANAALLAGWADLSASQNLVTSGIWNTSERMSVPHATQAKTDSYLSGLLGLTVRAEAPVADKMKIGLEASARYWTSRPTIKNPITPNGSVMSSATDHNGVRIGYDSAAEVGAALTFGYTF